MEERKDAFKREEAKITSFEDTKVSVGESKEEDDEDDENPIIKLKKPYKFEGVEYTEIDLSGMDELTANDMIAINRIMNRTNPGVDVMPEVSMEYAMNFACKATKLPIEFF